MLPEPQHEKVEFLTFSRQGVNNVLKLLNVSKASGTEEISPRLLKEGVPILASRISILFNMLITNSYFPPQWKNVNQIPVGKKKENSSSTKYGPI